MSDKPSPDPVPPAPTTPQWVLGVVLGTLCLISLGYAITMCALVYFEKPMDNAVFVAFNSVGSIAMGALTAVLTQTRVQTNDPKK